MAQKAAFGHKGEKNNTRTIKSWMYWCILKGWYDARMPVVNCHAIKRIYVVLQDTSGQQNIHNNTTYLFFHYLF